MKITGLDKLSKQMEEASEALKGMHGEFGTVTFNPDDPGSIELAIQSMHDMIDAKTARCSNNPVIGPLAHKMKEQYRSAILKWAAEERLKGEEKYE